MSMGKVKCKCGKIAPVMPKYCGKCGRGSMGNKKLKVVMIGTKVQQEDWKEGLIKHLQRHDGVEAGTNLEKMAEGIFYAISPYVKSQVDKSYEQGAKEARSHYYEKVRREAIKEERERIKDILGRTPANPAFRDVARGIYSQIEE